MRILLVNTNCMKPPIAPIGLDYLADSLVAAGHEPRLLDLCFSADLKSDIRSAVREFAPDVIGVSIRNTDDCYFSGGAFFVPEIGEMIAEIRQYSDAPVVLGGVGFSVMPETVMESLRADYGIAGEGEQALNDLLAALQKGKELERVPNLLYWQDDTLCRNPTSYLDLDSLPPRGRSLADNERYYREGGQAGFETRRGCDMRCTYCADPVSKGRSVRLRSPKLVVDELRTLLDQGIDHFHTCDCEFNVPGEHAKAICREIISQGLGEKIKWFAYCSVMPFDEEMADLFVRAGCAGVDFGADSGSDELLAGLGRNFRREHVIRTASLCHEHGITFMYDLLLGGPGETKETVRDTIELMRQIDADCVGLSMGVRIYEGTAMAEFVRSRGDLELNPDLYGAKSGNSQFMKPLYYIAPELGLGIVDHVREVVAGDTRFFLPSREEVESNYNYNDNSVLVNAIRDGARGAYWNILRQMR